jgi:hypothetical protein
MSNKQGITMKMFVAFATGIALLAGNTALGIAAGIDAQVIHCKDGTEVYLESACADRGGALKIVGTSKSTKIKTTKELAPKKAGTTTTTKTKDRVAAGSTKVRNTRVTQSTHSPTAKCVDGAMYFSRERRGACAAHGGVDKWIGW